MYVNVSFTDAQSTEVSQLLFLEARFDLDLPFVLDICSVLIQNQR